MRRILVIGCLLVVAACQRPGRSIDAWTLTLEGEAKGAAVELPSSQVARLPPFREAYYHLSTTVKLDQHETRQSWISLDCFHGALGMTVDGTAMRDLGDTGVGEHVWAIPPSLTARGEIDVVIFVRHDWDPYSQMLTAPRIASGPPMTGVVASWNRLTAMASLVICGFVALLFGVGWLFDRKRSEHAALAVAAAGAAITALTYLGVLPEAASWFGAVLDIAAHPMTGLGLVFFLHFAFELGRPPKWLVNGSFALVVAACAGAGSDAVLVIDGVLITLYWIVVGGYLLFRYAKLKGLDARLLLAAHAFMLLGAWLEIVELGAGQSFTSGAHAIGIGDVVLFAVATIVMQRRLRAPVPVPAVLAPVAAPERRQHVLGHFPDGLRVVVEPSSTDIAGLTKLVDRLEGLQAAGFVHDIRAFGLFAYEVLARKPADVDDLDLTPIDAPKLRDLVERCLEEDPEKRPSLAEVKSLLA